MKLFLTLFSILLFIKFFTSIIYLNIYGSKRFKKYRNHYLNQKLYAFFQPKEYDFIVFTFIISWLLSLCIVHFNLGV